jgi:D-3-phosphoglycerate dehydrogenase
MRLALDVFEPEPLAPDSPLRDLPNAMLTPHMVGHTVETHDRLPGVLLENIENALAGRLPPYLRNPEVAGHWTARWAK